MNGGNEGKGGPGVFSRFTKEVARGSGHAGAFVLSVILVLVWFASGPLFHWNDTWQLTINTTTTIITFLMVFVIQNTQMRDVEAMHVKLDALVLNTKGASNELLDLEDLPEPQLRALQEGFEDLGKQYRSAQRKGNRSRKPKGKAKGRSGAAK